MLNKPTKIVVSAVNIRKGGTLTILRQCLGYLSGEAAAGRMEVIALVHDRRLCDFPGIRYIEMPDTVGSWGRRLRAEYRDMLAISRQLQPIDLWLSLHDATPRVEARRQAVYCQTSFPFYRWQWRDWLMDWKIPVFAMMTRWVYRRGVHRNHWLIVQQQWLREGLSRMLGVPADRFIVAPPPRNIEKPAIEPRRFDRPTFFYASTPDCHKNFETLLRAAALLESQLGADAFQVVLTVDGTENRYARWLKKRWGGLKTVHFEGLMDRERLFATYAGSDCFLFPSAVETWGLPISEAMTYGKPMILSDLPYARETSAGSRQTAFFPCRDARALASLMAAFLRGDLSEFRPVAPTQTPEPVAPDWPSLFAQLLKT